MPNPLDDIVSPDDDPSVMRNGRIYVTPEGSGGNSLERGIQATAPQEDLPTLIGKLRDALLGAAGQIGVAGIEPGSERDALALRRDQLLGINGQERVQTLPERVVRSGVTLAGDVMSGRVDPRIASLRREDFTDVPYQPRDEDRTWLGRKLGLDPTTPQPSDEFLGRVTDMAGLAGGGALLERPGVATLGSGPVRQAAAMPKTETPVFYSALEHHVAQAPQDVMSGPQWAGWLKKQPGVKQEELQWTGVEDWLAGQKGKVNRDDVARYLDEHKVEVKDVTKSGRDINDDSGAMLDEALAEVRRDHPGINEDEAMGIAHDRVDYMLQQMEEEGNGPKYTKYQLPGGENYREHLLTLPEFKAAPQPPPKSVSSDPRYSAAEEAFQRSQSQYRSSHWDEPNVLAHVRTNDRDVGGVPSLHLEEIQSDWHQQGRKQGYTNKKPEGYTARQVRDEMHVFDPEGRHVGTMDPRLGEQGAIDAVIGHQGKAGVPDAPFKTSWPELALKRMVRMAAEEGKSRISWTPGEAQAARYDLSRHVDSLEYNPDTKHLIGRKQQGNINTTPLSQMNVEPKDLPGIVGKDVAEKLLQAPRGADNIGGAYHELKGQDLKVGGEGMKGFYDNMLPKMIEKLGKPYGVKVKKMPFDDMSGTAVEGVGTPKMEVDTMPSQGYWHDTVPKEIRDEYKFTIMHNGEPSGAYKTREAAEEALKLQQKQYAKASKDFLWYFDVPKQWQEQALGKGFPLFQAGIPFPLVPVDHDPFAKKEKR